MKKLYLFLAFLSFTAFVACEQMEATIDYGVEPISLSGTWVTVSTDLGPISTDSIRVMTFSDNAALEIGQINANGRWQVTTDILYTTDQSFIYIMGTDLADRSYEVTLEVIYQNKSVLVFRNKGITLDGQIVERESLVTMRKVNDNVQSQLLGSWVLNDAAFTGGKGKFSFNNNNFFDFYRWIEDDWVLSPDTYGSYYLYGPYLILDYCVEGTYRSSCHKIADIGKDEMRVIRRTNKSQMEYNFLRTE